MKNIQFKKIVYRMRRDVFTLNNAVIVVAFFIAVGWALGSVNVMERNYALQRDMVRKQQEQKLAELEVATLQYQQNYYKSDEYKELAARDDLGLAFSGETALILSPNSRAAKEYDRQHSVKRKISPQSQPTNTEQWIEFLMGKNTAELKL